MPNLTTKAVKATVRGQVQGVGFRQATRSTARALNLWGWVRNVGGSVEVWLQGEPEAVDRMIEWLWIGPSSAEVTGIESDAVAIDHYLQDFFIRQ